MDSIDTSGKALVEHWKWAADKGLMKSASASALRAACSQVLGVMDGWETLDVRVLNVDDVYRRFQNKRSKDFKPDSLDAYRKRFSQAVRLFLDYANDPTSWKAPSRESVVKREKPAAGKSGKGKPAEAGAVERPSPSAPPVGGLVEYPFPLREGRLAYLRLPADLKMAEVKRLTAYLTMLAVDAEGS